MTTDKAGKAYWDALWEGQPLPPPVDPTDQRLSNSVKLAFHDLFTRELRNGGTGGRLLEVGCARSTWLPYFARRHGFEVSGIDYSTDGCEQSRQLLAREGVDGQVVEGDLFTPPEHLLETFDVVVSFGLVEHFSDTAAAHAVLARFLKPEGLLVTVIPNMGGSLVGLLQRLLDRDVYDVHIPLDRRDLEDANRGANLHLVWCRYFMAFNWSVVNISNWRRPAWRRRADRALFGLSKVAWWLERRGMRLPPNRWTSPYIVAVARRVSGSPH